MRLWSLHPKYLDRIGLIAAWREALLAKAVINGQTKGYKMHPQLIRFYCSTNPTESISYYLQTLYEEGKKRDYNFDSSKFKFIDSIDKIAITKGQVEYEMSLLKFKIKNREPKLLDYLDSIYVIESNPIFTVTEGKVEQWERIKDL